MAKYLVNFSKKSCHQDLSKYPNLVILQVQKQDIIYNKGGSGCRSVGRQSSHLQTPEVRSSNPVIGKIYI